MSSSYPNMDEKETLSRKGLEHRLGSHNSCRGVLLKWTQAGYDSGMGSRIGSLFISRDPYRQGKFVSGVLKLLVLSWSFEKYSIWQAALRFHPPATENGAS